VQLAIDLQMNPSEETIRPGPLVVRIFITGENSGHSIACFEVTDPTAQRLAGQPVLLEMRQIRHREEHWAIVDLHGKAGHTRTVPVPNWVKAQLEQWTQAAAINMGRIFRRGDEGRYGMGDRYDGKGGLCHVVRELRPGRRHRDVGAARFAAELRSPLPRIRWRVGADSVSAQARVHSRH